MVTEIEELETHNTWEIIHQDDREKVEQDDGTYIIPSVVPMI